MWDEQKSTRFQQLRERQQESLLTEAEQTELSLLTQEIEAAEATPLTSAAERLRQERKALEARNQKLEVLVRRKESRLRRLRD